jgi:hypothetical protein
MPDAATATAESVPFYQAAGYECGLFEQAFNQ